MLYWHYWLALHCSLFREVVSERGEASTSSSTSRQVAGIVRRLGANISSSEIRDEEDIVIVDINGTESTPPAERRRRAAAPAIHHCNHCDKAFGEWENLVEHSSRRHPGRPRPVRSQSPQGPPRPRPALQTPHKPAQTNRASKGRQGRRCRNYVECSMQLTFVDFVQEAV